MHRVNSETPVSVLLTKSLFFFVFICSAVFCFTPSVLLAQAFDQLVSRASGIEIPEVPAAGAPVVYTAGSDLKVYFLNVGQGDSIYFELPGGHNALIDGGPSGNASGNLAKFLASKNVTKIDNVVLTHPHTDHYKGLAYVFDKLSVSNFYDNRIDNSGAASDDTLRAKIKSLGVNMVYPAAGDNLAWADGVAVKVLNSCPGESKSSDGNVLNDCSIVLKVSYQNTSMLFTGDMEADVEANLVAKYGSELDCDVLKVGHHGSQYSSSMAFLKAVSPKAAYIEVGTGNSYGHPTQNALANLAAIGATIYRTDLSGTMEYDAGNVMLASAGVASYTN